MVTDNVYELTYARGGGEFKNDNSDNLCLQTRHDSEKPGSLT